jgi:hypothetical protein
LSYNVRVRNLSFGVGELGGECRERSNSIISKCFDAPRIHVKNEHMCGGRKAETAKAINILDFSVTTPSVISENQARRVFCILNARLKRANSQVIDSINEYLFTEKTRNEIKKSSLSTSPVQVRRFKKSR